MKLRIPLSIAAVAFTAAFSAAAHAADTDPAGIAALQTYNLVVLGDLTSSSEVEGRTFVGGNLSGNSSNYQISASSASSTDVPGLTVVGNVTGGAKNLDNGSGAYVGGSVDSGFNLNGAAQTVKVGGTISNTNVNSNTVISGLNGSDPSFSANLGQYGSLMSTSMKDLSSQLGQQAANSTVTFNGSTGVFNAKPDSNGVAVFNISSDTLGRMSGIQFNTNGADTAIVNVTGSAISLNQNFLGGTGNLGQHVIWNFPDAASLTLSTAWGGSILAPDAAAHTYNYVQGSAVFGSLVQDGEMHVGTYTGNYQPPSDGSSSSSGGATEVPEPGVFVLFAVALGILMWRRHREVRGAARS